MRSPSRAKPDARAEKAQRTLAGLLRKRVVMDMRALRAGTGERSRRSLCRDLRAAGYLSSYSHAGRYYTLAHIPQFDERGLWFHQGIGFSRAGTLKETVVELVCAADRGRTHSELKRLLRVRVHNTLLALVRGGRIGREPVGSVYLYVSVDPIRAAEQIGRRKASALAAPVATAVVIAVLVEALRAYEVLAAPSVVAARLSARGVPVTAEQVEQIYGQHGLQAGKRRRNHPGPPSRR